MRLAVVVVAVALFAFAEAAAELPRHFVMPWFCLQRCGFNETQIRDHADQLVTLNLQEHVGIGVVAFERYNLGPNSTLVLNLDLFDMNRHLQNNATLAALVPTRIAMVSSFPYPPQFLSWMRQLFDSPETFIAPLISDLVLNNISGVNIDFEPTSPNATAKDASDYASFLMHLKNRLAAHGKVLTVAGATWSNIWNLTAIAQALATSSGATGYFTSMNTYTYEDSVFLEELELNLNTFAHFGSLQSLTVGLETWPGKFTEAQLSAHFSALASHSVCQVAVWDMPIPANMIPFLANLTARCTSGK